MRNGAIRMTATLVCLLAATVGVPLRCAAQQARDPTLPPNAVAQESQSGATARPLGAVGTNVVVREGKPYLVVGSRLVAPGQRVGSAKLVRITETEIWLDDGSGVQKIARFAGVQRTDVRTTACPPKTPSKAQKKDVPRKSTKNSAPPQKKVPPTNRPTRDNEPHDC